MSESETSTRSLASFRGSESTYDRRRLFDRDAKPETITSLKDVNHEHQGMAMARGYKSVLEMVVDEMAEKLREFEQRLSDLENQGGD